LACPNADAARLLGDSARTFERLQARPWLDPREEFGAGCRRRLLTVVSDGMR